MADLTPVFLCFKWGKGYPCRAIRTNDYLYIYNFEPARWPSGSPDASVCARAIPFGEVDTSPTKTFMMEHRDQHGVARLAALAFGMRPAEELYDVRRDPHHMHNLIDDPAHQDTRRQLARQLMAVLEAEGDPRVVEPDCRF